MKPSWRQGDWSTLFPTIVAALWISVPLTYLWDTADHGKLILLISTSVTFGLGLGQLPPVRFLLRRHRPDDAQRASETRPHT